MVWSGLDAPPVNLRRERLPVMRGAVQDDQQGRVAPLAAVRANGPLIVLAVALVLAVAPAWNPVWYQDDQLPTLFRTYHTDLAHHWGIVYPRLAPELGFGYGRLLHQFYPPFGVELAAWLHTLGLGIVDSARATFSLCLIASAVGMYAYARAVLGGRWPAVLAALGYLWAPYVLLDAHKGGVLGESIAMAIMPWALLAVHRLVRGGGWLAFGGAAGLLALVVLGHNITALFFVGLASIYAALLAAGAWLQADASGKLLAARRLVQAAGAVLLALALAAVYWAPALLELSYSRVSDQRTGDFTVTRYLVQPLELLQPLIVFDYYVEAVPRFGLTAALLTLLALGLFTAALLGRRRPSPPPVRYVARPDALAVAAFGACFVVVLLLQLRVSAPIWDTVPLISYVQFPQRLFVFGSFAGALVLGSLPWALASLTARANVGAGGSMLAVLLLGITSLPGIYWTWPVAGSHVIDEEQVGIGTQAERRLSERRAFDDYFPAGVEEDANQIIRPPTVNRSEAYRVASAGPVPRLTLRERGYVGMAFDAEAAEPSTVILHQFYFPGWQAEANGMPLTVTSSGPLGLVTVTVPAGQQRVHVWFGETSTRMAAIVVSGAALAVLLAILARGLGGRRVGLGVGLLLLVVVVPRLLHNTSDHIDGIDERRAPQALAADVTPTARVVALELAAAPVARGSVVPVTLVWQALAYTNQDLQTGLQLVAPDGSRVVSERWGRPNRERTPMGKWLVGELVPDTLLLRIPESAPSGTYRLRAGLRDDDAKDRTPLGLAEVGTLDVR